MLLYNYILTHALCMPLCRLSASCTHVSALLHALVSLSPSTYSAGSAPDASDDEALPVTSFACQWKVPSRRKDCTLPLSKVVFEKHSYGRERKRSLKLMEEFDPRPAVYQNTAKDLLQDFLGKVKGKGLGVSLLLDPEFQANFSGGPLQPKLPSKTELQYRVSEFKKSLKLPPEKTREIEQTTRDQCNSPLWFSVRRYRLTASYFGSVYCRRTNTPPQSLVLQILGTKQVTAPALEWGNTHEEAALQQYRDHQHSAGHSRLFYCRSGFIVSDDHPFLGASPDAVVYDPDNDDPFGLAEVKCPYSVRFITPAEACSHKDFSCTLETSSTGQEQLKLKRNHKYYSQVQGQMSISKRKWCDFIIFTTKGLSVERIPFDADFWNNELLPKLIEFYDNCLAPEIISPVHVLGIPVRDLREM